MPLTKRKMKIFTILLPRGIDHSTPNQESKFSLLGVLKNTLTQEHIHFLLYNNVSGLSMARRYWRIPSSPFEVRHYPPRPLALPPDIGGYCQPLRVQRVFSNTFLAMPRPLSQYVLLDLETYTRCTPHVLPNTYPYTL